MRSQLQMMSDFLSSTNHGGDLGYVSGDTSASVADTPQVRNKPRNSMRKDLHEKEPARRCNSEGIKPNATWYIHVAAKSGSSGRSGDCVPPIHALRRRKSSCPDPPTSMYDGPQAKSWYDSGISMSTRSMSVEQNTADDIQVKFGREQLQSGHSKAANGPSNRSLSTSSASHDDAFYKSGEATKNPDNLVMPSSVSRDRGLSMTRSVSCSVIPSSATPGEETSRPKVTVSRCKSSDPESTEEHQENGMEATCSHQEVFPDHVDAPRPKKKLSDAQKQVLRQIYGRRGARVTADADVKDDDCGNETRSRFPLPEHMNYPLNLYRESADKAAVKSPIQRIKAKLRKTKSNSWAKDVEVAAASEGGVIAGESSRVRREDQVDSVAILSRLATDPSGKKGLMKRLLDRISGRSYSAQDSDSDRSILGLLRKKNLHSSSEDISIEFEAHFRPRSRTMLKSTSMPALDATPDDDFYQFPTAQNLAVQGEDLDSTSARAYSSFRNERSSSISRGRSASFFSSVPDRLDMYSAANKDLDLEPACNPPRAFAKAANMDGSKLSEPVEGVCRSPASGPRSPTSGPRSPTSGPRSPTSGPRSPTSGLRSPTSGPRSPTSGPLMRGRRSSSVGSVFAFPDKSNVDAALSASEDSLSQSFPPAWSTKDTVEKRVRKTSSCYDLYRDAPRELYRAENVGRRDDGCSRNDDSRRNLTAHCSCCCRCGTAAHFAVGTGMFPPQYLPAYWPTLDYTAMRNYSADLPTMPYYRNVSPMLDYQYYAPPMHNHQVHDPGMGAYRAFCAAQNAHMAKPISERAILPQATGCRPFPYHSGPPVIAQMDRMNSMEPAHSLAPFDISVSSHVYV